MERTLTDELSSRESVSEAVVTAVSRATDRDPVPDPASPDSQALESLYSVVDPDALDSLFGAANGNGDSSRPRGRISFSYHDHRVTVHSDGRVAVEPAD